MLYYFLYQLIFRQYGAASDSYFYKGLNVFQYVTFRTAWATITALVISLLFGKRVIRKLSDLKFGQEIRDEGPASHQSKRGTPTMGGVLIIGSVFLSTILWARLDSVYLWLALAATTLFALVPLTGSSLSRSATSWVQFERSPSRRAKPLCKVSHGP